MLNKTQSHIITGLVILMLTYLVLGHEGRISDGSQFRMTLFADFIPAVQCLLECQHKSAPFWYLLINILGNIIVFIPLGAALVNSLRWHTARPGWSATLIGAGLSLFYEVVQLGIPGRVSALDDVILNALGTSLGASLMLILLYSAAFLHTRTSKGTPYP